MTHSLRLFDNFLSNISKTSSIISLTIWLFTQIPQIILNHKRRDVSLSISFVGLTFLADIINLTYQILIKDSPYSILLVYMIILDLIIISQYFYYSRYFKSQCLHHHHLNNNNNSQHWSIEYWCCVRNRSCPGYEYQGTATRIPPPETNISCSF